MKLHELLKVPSIELIEPDFESLVSTQYTDEILLEIGTEAKIVINEQEWPILLALKNEECWKCSIFILRPPVVDLIDKFEYVGGEVLKYDTEIIMKAVREYYIDMICASVPCAIEDFSSKRAEDVKDLIKEIWGEGQGEMCIDCGCGSGMGALALRNLGFSPVCYDNDPSLLHLGVETGRLKADESMCIDARYASFYSPRCRYGLALMAGSISAYTSHIWKDILEELIGQCQNVIVTVESENEAQTVKSWAEALEKKVTLKENERDGFYDRWVCIIS